MPWPKPLLTTMFSARADPVEVVGQRLVQFRGPAAVEVDQPLAGNLVEHPAQRAQPGRAGELRDVGAPVAEVDPQGALGGSGRRLGQRGRAGVGHLGVAARAADQVTLGHQLRVRLDHDTAGQAEIGREDPAGRQHRVGPQVALPDALADAARQLAMQRDRQLTLDLDEQLRRADEIGHDGDRTATRGPT
jgi:hypothetical protein